MYSVHDTPCGVGFPIRTSADQRSLASPRGFSQRATSFIASWRQGIHRTLFSRSRISAAARAQDQTAPDEVSPTRPARAYPDDNSTICLSQLHTHDERHPSRHATGLPTAPRWNNIHQIQIHRLKEHARHKPQGSVPENCRGKSAPFAWHRNLGTAQPEAPTHKRHRMADRATMQCIVGRLSTPPGDFTYGEMEASGFEPLTPCLQSRCSTS